MEQMNKEKLIEAVSALNEFCGASGLEAHYLAAAMKHLSRLHEKNFGITIEIVDWTELEPQ